MTSYLLRPQSSKPLKLFQKGLALLVICGSPKELELVKSYTTYPFHYTTFPAWVVPSPLVLGVLWFMRASAAVLILAGIAVPFFFGVLGFLCMYGLFLFPMQYHNNSYLLGLLCVWMAFFDSPLEKPAQAWQYLLLLLQVTVIYGFSALHKFLDPEWRSGRALFAYAQDNVFPFMTSWLSSSMTAFLAPLTMGVEVFLAVGLWISPVRRWALIVGVLFHMAIESMTNVGYFSWEMILLYLGAVGAWEPSILAPLWRLFFGGLILLGLRNAFPDWALSRYLAFPMGLVAAAFLCHAQEGKNPRL